MQQDPAKLPKGQAGFRPRSLTWKSMPIIIEASVDMARIDTRSPGIPP